MPTPTTADEEFAVWRKGRISIPPGSQTRLMAGGQIEQQTGPIAFRVDCRSEAPMIILRERVDADARWAWPGSSLLPNLQIPFVEGIVVPMSDEQFAALRQKLAKDYRPRICRVWA